MTDLTEIYEDGTGEPRYVARISRTATGIRTFTVGMSLDGGDITTESVRRLFDLEKAVSGEIDGPRKSARRSGQSITAQLRRSVIVTALRRVGAVAGYKVERWLTTPELMETAELRNNPNVRRSQLVADLSYLVREGVLEVEQSKGRTPSRYRLAQGGK